MAAVLRPTSVSRFALPRRVLHFSKASGNAVAAGAPPLALPRIVACPSSYSSSSATIAKHFFSSSSASSSSSNSSSFSHTRLSRPTSLLSSSSSLSAAEKARWSAASSSPLYRLTTSRAMATTGRKKIQVKNPVVEMDGDEVRIVLFLVLC